MESCSKLDPSTVAFTGLFIGLPACSSIDGTAKGQPLLKG